MYFKMRLWIDHWIFHN